MRVDQLIHYFVELINLTISFLMHIRKHPIGVIKVPNLYNISAPIVIEEQPPQRLRKLQVIIDYPQSDVIVTIEHMRKSPMLSRTRYLHPEIGIIDLARHGLGV